MGENMLKRQFKNPYYLLTYEDLIEEGFWSRAKVAAGNDYRYAGNILKQNAEDFTNSSIDAANQVRKDAKQAFRRVESDAKDATGAIVGTAYGIPKTIVKGTYGAASTVVKDAFKAGSQVASDISDLPGKAYTRADQDAQKLYGDFKSGIGTKTKPITSRLYNRKVGLGALLGAGLVAGGIAAYNHFTDNDIPLTMPTIGGGILGGVTGALHGDIPAIGSFIGSHAAIIGTSIGLIASLTALVLHPYITLGIVGSLGSFAYMLNRKENVDQIKTLSIFIERVYSKAIILRYNELQTIKATNQKAFQEASSKCELGTPAFAKHGLGVNYNCALEAYIGYCTAMFVGLLTVYLQSVNAKYVNLKHVTKIEQVLAIQEDTGLNIMLNEVYHKLIKSIAFIFKPFPEVVSKYNIFIDNTILNITQKLDTKVQARPVQQQQQQYNNPRPAYKPNDHRQFKNKYLLKPA